MILIKNRFIIGTIVNVITAILKGVYMMLKIFHVRFIALMALLGIIFYYTEVFTNNNEVTVGYVLVCVIYVLYLMVKSYKKHAKSQTGERKNKKGGVQIIPQTETKMEPRDEQLVEPEKEPIVQPVAEKTYPIYYSVKQNSNYVMAEYADRYELFQKTPMGLKKVRTDYKER